MDYKGLLYCPKEVSEDSVFFYSEYESLRDAHQSGSNEIKKRAFVVHFQPPDKQGWYKLRFASRTNRILGVRADVKPSMIDKETKVNIGTVQLTVEALEKVKKELQSKLEKFSLPDAEMLIEHGKLEEFNAALIKAKQEAAKDEDVNEIRGKIDLFGYIVKLLAPGQSRNFDQNRGAIEFNVRVITPKPPISEPVINAPTYVAGFDKIPAVFEFTISPYQGANANRVDGKVVDVNGTTVARLSMQAVDMIAGLNVVKPSQGGKQDWRATTDQNLAPGKYKIELIHTLYNKPKNETIDLEIFKTGLANAEEIDRNLKFLTVYGANLKINAISNSGSKIKSNQFRVYLNTDIDEQRPPFEGLAMDEPLEVSAKAKEVTLEVTWIQPYTNQEVELYSKTTYPIKQKQPTVNTRKQRVDPSSDDGKKIKISIRDLEISYPPIGTIAETGTNKAKISIVPKNGTVNLKGGSYEFSSDPSVEIEDMDGYLRCNVTAELTGSLERGSEDITGTVTLELHVTGTNPFNGKPSDLRREAISVPVKLRIEKSRGGRPSGGGAPRPGGGTPPPGGRR